jgi:hypothetical protein
VTIWRTLLRWVWTQSREDTSRPEPATTIFPIDQRAPRVPAEYLSLYAYLAHRYASIVVLTFEQLEALLGFALPAAASTERGWWTDAAVLANRYSNAWVEAGRTATPNLSARTVTFERHTDPAYARDSTN